MAFKAIVKEKPLPYDSFSSKQEYLNYLKDGYENKEFVYGENTPLNEKDIKALLEENGIKVTR